MSSPDPFALSLAHVMLMVGVAMLGIFVRDLFDRYGRTERSNYRQDAVTARYEEKIAGLEQRLNQHAERLGKVESHAGDISQINSRLTGLETKIDAMYDLFKSAVQRRS